MPTGKLEWGRILGRLSPYTIQKGFRYLKHYGPKEFWIRLHERFEPEEVPYGPWYEEYRPDIEELEKQKKKKWKYQPKISIAVPAYKTPEKFLRQMMDSLLEQTYENWELCIANASPKDASMEYTLMEYARRDPRIRWKKLEENKGIAENTNEALDMAEGEYIGLLDHDDLLAPNALYEVAKVLEKEPDTEVLYTDEDKVRGEDLEHFQPHLKPDFNPDLLRSNNYICHFFVVKRSILEKTGGFRSEYDGAQDYDFIFRCTEEAGKIRHIPEILYHWRTHEASTADNPESKLYAFEAGKRAIEANLKRSGLVGTVTQTKDYGFYRVKYSVVGNPLVSIIIPNKDAREDLEKCINSILGRSTYSNYEILIVENNSTEEKTFQFYKKLEAEHPKARVVYWDREFNYSAINNYGASFAKGEYLLLLNNDTEIINEDCLEELLGYCMRSDVGAVGARMYYEDDTIQHAGVVIGLGAHRSAGHTHYKMPREHLGYMGRLCYAQDVTAVTGACLMVKRSVYEEVGGLDETFTISLNDVDFCLKIREKGYLNIFTPFAELYHYESKTRGMEEGEKLRRYERECEHFRERWKAQLDAGDPYYNPNFSLDYSDFTLRF